MKPIKLKTIGYLCLKTGLFFESKVKFLAHQSSMVKHEIKAFTSKLVKAVTLESRIEDAKALISSPFKRYCAKVSAYRAVKSWLFSLPKKERVLFA